ncbi:MAG TPA: hypothetical protein VND63_07280 [Rhodanobacteraceae bacterium]|nr:hypothetical protein [Rhodanobacteraceae bacterium]
MPRPLHLAFALLLAVTVTTATATATEIIAPPGTTLEQAVEQVQRASGGKVLKADSVRVGRYVIYRIKMLTPDGHVRVVQVRTEPKEKH